MATTVTVGWGAPLIEVRKVSDTTGAWQKFATPVDGSTSLESTQGDKMEAAIEGGTNEAVKYKANTYQLTFDVRQVPERTDPITDVDGVVSEEYSVRITPENPAAISAYIQRAAVNVQTKFDAENGLVRTYTFDVLKPDEGPQVKLGLKTELFPEG